MIEYVLIDLDGTLLDFDKGEKEAFIDTIKSMSNYIPNDTDCMKYSELNEYYFNEYSKGNMTRDEFHFKRFDEINKHLKLNLNIMDLDRYYVNSLKYQAEVFDDVIETLEYLKDKYKLYIASNGMNEIQIKRLEKANIINYFENVYVSEKIGFNKPQLGFFEYVINDINDFDKSKYIIVGDRLDSDILGGNNFGIKTILLDRKNKLKSSDSTFYIKNLYELKKIL